MKKINFLYGLLAIDMHYNEDTVLVVALTCVKLVPITFLVIFLIGRREAREGTRPLCPKKRPGRDTQAILALSSMRNENRCQRTVAS